MDPKYSTNVQRTWNYFKDPAIRAVEDYGIDNTKTLALPQYDNNLSLSIGTFKT